MSPDQIRWSHPSYYHFKNNSFGSKTFIEMFSADIDASDKIFRNGGTVNFGNVTAILPEGVKVISASEKDGTTRLLYEVSCPNDTNGDGGCHLCAKHGGCANFRINFAKDVKGSWVAGLDPAFIRCEDTCSWDEVTKKLPADPLDGIW